MRRLRDVLSLLSGQVARSIGWLYTAAARWWRVALAVGLIVGSLAFGVPLLSQDSPRRAEPASIGFVPPGAAKPGRGFSVGIVARLTECGEPLQVTVVAAGTAEYWLDNAQALRGRARFRLAVPNVVGEKVRVRPGTTATDVVDPDTARLRRSDVPLIAPKDFQIEHPRKVGDLKDLTIVHGTIRNWQATLAPIVAEFQADWTEDRGVGSCFIHLPAIAGDLSILSAQRALGNARDFGKLIVEPDELTVDSRGLAIVARYRPGLEVAYGSATVRVYDGSIDSDDSLPPPTESVNGNPTWTCVGRARSTRLLAGRRSRAGGENEDYVLLGPDPLGSAGALSSVALRAGPSGDCSAVVAAIESSAQWKRDLMLLLIGAFVSLGVTILVEFALGMRQAAPAR